MRKYFMVDSFVEQLEQSESIFQCDTVPVPDIDENQNYIFISYSHKDYKKVYADLAVMYRAGVRFWYDRGLSAGKNWDSEVKSMIESPRCSGVIFFLSESLFLSKSVNQEIDLVIGNDTQPRKNYFCVNLSEEQPGHLLRTILRMDDSVLDSAGLDMDRISVLARAFSDKQTYLRFSDTEHNKQLLNQIAMQFDVIELQENKRGYLVNKGTNERIQITEDSFMIGKEKRKCHYCIENDTSVSRMHMCISCQGGGNLVMDLGSMGGTYLNGEKIQAMVFVPLRHGDAVTIGQQTLVFYTEM